MAPRDLHNWAENLEAGRDDEPELQIAACLRNMRQPIQAPQGFRVGLRDRLLKQYDLEPDLALELRAATPQVPGAPAALKSDLRQRLLAEYAVDEGLAARLRASKPEAHRAPLRFRLDLRQRLLQLHATQRASRKQLLGNYGRPILRFAVAAASVILLLAFSGGLSGSFALAERVWNRIFVVDTSKDKTTIPSTLRNEQDPAVIAEETAVAKQIATEAARDRTAVALIKKNGGLKAEDVQAVQRELPFTMVFPAQLPEGATAEFIKKQNSGKKATGVQIRYRLPGNKLITIFESLPTGQQNVKIDRSSVVKQLTIHGNPAVIYNPDPTGSGGGPVVLVLQWSDGQRWFEIWSTLGPEQMSKIAESMTP
jgi:hypothetical protein